MKMEDYAAKMKEIVENLSDQAKVTTLLSELTDDYTTTTAEKETATKTAETLTADNEKLRQANMSLFLKVGDTKPNETVKTIEDNKPKFDDLFDKDGNLI